MNLKKNLKNVLPSPKSIKKKLIVKSKRLTIDIPEGSSIDDLNKNSPKHRHHPTAHKSVSRPLVSFEKTSKNTSVKPKSKVFLFPPEPKPNRNSSKLGSPKPLKKSITKPKTPMQKKKQLKLIKRPKTSASPKKIEEAEPSIKSLVTQVSVNMKQTHEEIYNEHLFQTYQGLKISKSLPPVDLDQLSEKRLQVPRRPGFELKKTVVFDLDETLVHCCENIEESEPDVILPVTFPSGEVINAGINIRPYAFECLKELNKHFEVFVFTASHQCYANVVLDYLDPEGDLIHQRFFRENCINMNGIYIKDLRIFANRKLSEMIIVDNAAYSYAYQVDNGIPIISWHDDRDDKELMNLVDYLLSLVDAEDVREVNFETFHLRTFYEDYMNEFLIQQQ
jgi:Dullard-like phosphatase family protein